MRFIYESEHEGSCDNFRIIEYLYLRCRLKYNSIVEDTQDEIMWLIKDYNSYEEMRDYYVKG